MEKKKKEFSKWLPRVHRVWLSGKRKSSPSALAAECFGSGSRGRGSLPLVLWLHLSGKESSPSALSAALGEERVFP